MIMLLNGPLLHPILAYFISKANASVKHISRIAENDIHLPESYGKYQLSNWQIHPPTKRSWWQKKLFGCSGSVNVSVTVALSGVGIWWFLRRKQQSSLQYKPVDSMVCLSKNFSHCDF
ncbi:hypothetical protein HanRHA438_Chr09g0408531 [Helianthus annuus]|nr:hypothetical protein HanRHA438_Chr09g0408531 [Helianthus annuus]